MASIRKRGSSYQITVSNGYDINGKKILETTTFTPDPNISPKQQQKELDTFVFKFEEKVKSGKVLDGNKITLKEYFDRWFDEYALKNLEETTLDNYEYQIKSKVLPAIGHLKLSLIKPLHLQSFYNNLLEDGVRSDGKSGGYSVSTIKKVHAILSSLFSTAVQWQLIESNPCERVKPPKDKGKKSIACDDESNDIIDKQNENNINHFTLDQAEKFLNALNMNFVIVKKSHHRKNNNGKTYKVNEYQDLINVPEQFKVFFNIALFGGLRKSEILGLTWNDIDFENNTIQINKGTVYTKRKVITKSPKNETSIRTIALPISVINILKQYKKNQQQYRLSLGDQWIGKDYIFIQWNGKQMHPSTPYHTFKKVIHNYNNTVTNESDKLPDITLHGLRHTSATLLIAQKTDIKTVSNRLGHAQTSTTLNIYAAALHKPDIEAANALEDMFKKKA